MTGEQSDDAIQHQEPAEVSVSGGKLIDRLEAVSEVSDIATIYFDEDGLHVSESTDYEALMVDLSIPVTDHPDDGADVPEPFKARTSMHHLISMVMEVGNRMDTVSFRYEYDTESLYTYVDDEMHAEQISIETPPTEPVTEPPEVKRDATASVRSSYLVGVVAGVQHRAGDDDETLAVVGREDELTIGVSFGVDFGEEWPLPDEAVRSVSVEGDETVTRVSADRLRRIVDGLPMSWSIDVAFSQDYPLYVSVAEDWEYWLAPRIVEEDDSQ